MATDGHKRSDERQHLPLIGKKLPPVPRERLAGASLRNFGAMTKGSGFTLIELLVTIAIAAILLALAVPSFRETTLNNQRASRSNEMVGSLNYARAQAVGLRSRVIVCRTDDSSAAPPVCGTGDGWEEGWVVVQDVNNDNAVDAGDTILRRQGALISAADIARPAAEAAEIFTIRGNGLPALGVVDQIAFAPSGTSANNGTLIICDSRDDFTRARAIEISVGGRLHSFDTYTVSGARDGRLEAGITTCQR